MPSIVSTDICTGAPMEGAVHFDKRELVAGVPILQVRDLLRQADRSVFTIPFITERLKISPPRAEEVSQEMLKREWIETAEGSKGEKGFGVTREGRRLAMFRAVSRISKAKADKLLSDFIERCAEIDTRDELGHYVVEARVFGSYLTDAEDLGDLDLLVSIKERPIPNRDIVKHSLARAAESGRGLSFIEAIGYCEIEVLKLLKHRSPYISLHTLDDPIAAKAESKVVFRTKRFKPS